MIVVFATALVALAALISAGGFATPQPAKADVPLDCADLLLVAARGSGQTIADDKQWSSESSQFFGAVRKLTPAGLEIEEYRLGDGNGYGGYKYPAEGVFRGIYTFGKAYFDSVNQGVRELSTFLQDRRFLCPGEEWILSGYSQGGQVVTQTLKVLPRVVRDRVGFAATFGDPTLNAFGGLPCRRAWYARSNVQCFQHGLFPMSVPSDLKGRYGVWCDSRDPVCAVGASNLAVQALRLGPHGNYPNAAIPEAAKEARSAIRADTGWTLEDLEVDGGNGTDLMVVFDTTGSMGGEIAEAQGAAGRLADEVTQRSLGRIGLVQFRDAGDSPEVQLVQPLTSNAAQFKAALSTLQADGGGDTPEAQLAGVMKALNGVSWRPGATKLLTIITDAPGKDPDPITGSTKRDVIATANAIDPVGLYGVDVCSCNSETASFMEPLADGTGGAVMSGTDGLGDAFDDVFADAAYRPVVVAPLDAFAEPGVPLTLSAEGSYDPDSAISSYKWDLDGDGSFERVTSEPTVEHTFANPGTVNVGILAVSEDGGIGAGLTTVTVSSSWRQELVPGLPQGVTAIETETGGARVSWTAPSAGPAADAYLVSTGDGTFAEVVDASSAPNAEVSGLDHPGEVVFEVSAIADGVPGPVGRSSPLTLSADAEAPDTRITSGPEEGGVVDGGAISVGFSSDATDLDGFECSVDGGVFRFCSSPSRLASVAEGSHRFEVRAVDLAGHVDPTPAHRSFTVSSRDCSGLAAQLKGAKNELAGAQAKLKKAKKKGAPKRLLRKLQKKVKSAGAKVDNAKRTLEACASS